MSHKKNFWSDYAHLNVGLRLLSILPLLLLLTSCATFIPGLDRILFSKSSAKVGPIVTVDEQYPLNDAQDITPVTQTKETVSERTSNSLNPADQVELNPTTNQVDDAKPTLVAEQPKQPPAAANSGSDSIEKIAANTGNAQPSETLQTSVVKAKPKETAVEFGAVSGNVILIGERQQQLSALGTMITMTPTSMISKVKNEPSQVHIIDMEDKTYQPRYSTINAGDQVVFVNKDNIRHNVFSSSGNNAFDLGTYGAGLKRAVTLEEPGIVKIYCNIHADMVTFVAVGNQGLSVKTDDQGRYRIDDVLPGTYEVTIWNIRGETKRVVEVKANATSQLVDRINIADFRDEPHKNKFGDNYSQNSSLFEDEFY